MKHSVTIHEWFLNLKLQFSLRLPWDIVLTMSQCPVFRIPVSHWLYCSRALRADAPYVKRAMAVSLHEKRDLFSCRDTFIDQKTFAYTENVFCLRTTLRQPNSPAKFAVWKGDHYSTSPSVFYIRKRMQRHKSYLQQVARTANSALIQQGATRQTSFLSLIITWYWASGAAHQTTNTVYSIVETS